LDVPEHLLFEQSLLHNGILKKVIECLKSSIENLMSWFNSQAFYTQSEMLLLACMHA